MQSRRHSKSRLNLEALNDRLVPTVVTTIPLGQQTDSALVRVAVSSQQQSLSVDGTFQVTGVHGSELSAFVEGNLRLDNGVPSM